MLKTDEEYVNLELIFPDNTKEIIPLDKKSFEFIANESLKHNVTIEEKIIEIINNYLKD